MINKALLSQDRSILYIHYTNPAGYPPLLHGARILADGGWNVRMFGTTSDGADGLRVPKHSQISVTTRPLPPAGPARRLHYARFVAAAVREVARTRPDWVYASDPFSALVAIAVKHLGLARVVYHEHDAPGPPATGFMRAIGAARRVAARTADLLVVPNEERLGRLVAESGRRGPSVCVWNCPSVREVAPLRAPADGPLMLYYHGSLNEARLPLTVLDAMAQVEHPLRLLAIGYETIGSGGFGDHFRKEAKRLGLEDRVDIRGPMTREDLMPVCRTADVGLAMMPFHSGDSNLSAMVGASNKAFDYLAGGLALVVSDLPAWRDLYVTSGYGLAADPRDADSLAAAFSRLASDPAATRQMGENGRNRILHDWNYEVTFTAVLDGMYSYEKK